MFLTVLSAIVMGTCIVASARRLDLAVAPTALEPAMIKRALGASDVFSRAQRLRSALGDEARFEWERELLQACSEPVAAVREALISEQLTELDGRQNRLARVPRACASICTSAGFLFASVGLLQALALPLDEQPVETLHSALASALSAAALGIAGMSFCVSVHFRARRALREWLADLDALVKVLGSSIEQSVDAR